MKFRFLFSLVALVFLFVSHISAEQEKPNLLNQSQIKNPQSIDQELQRKIMFARKLIAARNYDGAASFLEVLYETEQNNSVVINLLRQCYTQLKLYFKLEELIKKQIESNPNNLGFYLSLAELSAQQGKDDEALAHYKKAASLINGINRVRFQLFIQSMLTYNLEADAEKYILGWRKESGDNSLLGDKMGLIYERKKEYDKAMAEYCPMLADSSRIGNNVEKEIVELLLFEDSAPIAEEYLLEQNKKELNIRVVKILAMHYIRSGQLDKSFAFTKLRDSLSEKNGNSLISYMHTCKREKLFDESIRMGVYLLSQYDQPAIRNRARFLIAESYTNKQQYEKSLQIYNEIFETTKSVREKTDALYYTAKVYQNYIGDVDSALIYLDSLTRHYKSGINYMNALVDIPYCYVQRGELQKAKERFLAFENKRLHMDIKEKVYYQLAQTLFFEKNIDSCKTMLSKLLVNYPTGFYVNDALSLLKVIQTGADTPYILYDYASAMLFEIQGKRDSVIIMYDKIAQNKSMVLADFALFKLTETLLLQNDSLKAIEYINQMEENFSDSYYFPYSLKQKADILLKQNKKADEAYNIYRHLLKEFPNYPFISEVRKILRTGSEEKLEQNS